jgi:prepilin-type N-terminal cleavage/methylation domain-containing protein
MAAKHHIKTKGFTLVELSIVLVIIGLIVGGVLTGRDLIYAAQIRKVVGEYEQYATAYNTFKIKYNCIPGDCANSLTLFGAVTDGYTGSPHGNDMIENYEIRYVCQQLSIAGLVKAGCISGFPFPAGGGVYPNINALPTSYSPTMLMDIGYQTAGIWTEPNLESGNYIYFEGQTPVGGSIYGPVTPIFNPNAGLLALDAILIDQKMDDGLPYSGRMRQSTSSWYCGTAATNTYYPTNYHDAAGAWECASMWKLD